jgi:hypothetical protein
METHLPLSFGRHKGRLAIRLQAIPMGSDWCLVLSGGDTPHLGAAAVAEIRPGPAGEGSGVDVSVITLPGHKEDILVRTLAGRVAAVLGANVTVCCGIHLDRITPEEIQDALALCEDMAEEFVRAIKREAVSPKG